MSYQLLQMIASQPMRSHRRSSRQDQLQDVTRLAQGPYGIATLFHHQQAEIEWSRRAAAPTTDHRGTSILTNLFEEMATTVPPRGLGPVLHVEVWYLHHDAYPECHAPRMVELDSTREFWYADLCMAWLDHIARTQPLRVLISAPQALRTSYVPRLMYTLSLSKALTHRKLRCISQPFFLEVPEWDYSSVWSPHPTEICTQGHD